MALPAPPRHRLLGRRGDHPRHLRRHLRPAAAIPPPPRRTAPCSRRSRAMAAEGDAVRVTLRHPFPALPELLAQPALAAMPLHRIAAAGAGWTRDRPMVASGAFRLTSWALHESIRLEPQPAPPRRSPRQGGRVAPGRRSADDAAPVRRRRRRRDQRSARQPPAVAARQPPRRGACRALSRHLLLRVQPAPPAVRRCPHPPRAEPRGRSALDRRAAARHRQPAGLGAGARAAPAACPPSTRPGRTGPRARRLAAARALARRGRLRPAPPAGLRSALQQRYRSPPRRHRARRDVAPARRRGAAAQQRGDAALREPAPRRFRARPLGLDRRSRRAREFPRRPPQRCRPDQLFGLCQPPLRSRARCRAGRARSAPPRRARCARPRRS